MEDWKIAALFFAPIGALIGSIATALLSHYFEKKRLEQRSRFETAHYRFKEGMVALDQLNKLVFDQIDLAQALIDRCADGRAIEDSPLLAQYRTAMDSWRAEATVLKSRVHVFVKREYGDEIFAPSDDPTQIRPSVRMRLRALSDAIEGLAANDDGYRLPRVRTILLDARVRSEASLQRITEELERHTLGLSNQVVGQSALGIRASIRDWIAKRRRGSTTPAS